MLFGVSNKKHDDTGKKAGHGFTVSGMMAFKYTKMAEAGNTNTTHVLGWWLNSVCIENDFMCNN